jgi:branched-chain amino acid transport system substrate-binding protein
MKHSCPFLSILCVAALLWLPARAEPGVTQDTIAFGQVAAFEGPAGLLGREFREGILAAFEEANKAGGVKGRKLRLISSDDGYEPLNSMEAAKRLVRSGRVFAFIGSIGTPTSAVIAPIASEAGVPFLAPFSGAAFLREPFNPNVINIRASYGQEAEAMMDWLTGDKGISRVAIVYQDDAFGRAGLGALRAALGKRGLEPAAEAVFERNTVAVKSALLTMQRAQPEAVVLIGPYKPCAEFIKLARKMELNATFLATSFVGANALARELGPLGGGIVVSQVMPSPSDNSLPLSVRFQEALRAVKPSAEAGFVELEGYLAGRLAIAVLEKLPDEPIRREFLARILGNSFDLDGFQLNFPPGSNQGSGAVFLTVLQRDGTFIPIAGTGQATRSARKLPK